jgi:hypothetical protein
MTAKAKENRTTRICAHTISYWYRKDMEMPECEEEHVKEMICEGYVEGELCCIMSDGNTENRGWWSIDRS